MAGLSAPGIGSGLDVNGIVGQLIALERRPLQALQQRTQEFQSQLSAYGQLKSSLSSFASSMEALATPDKFKVFTSTSSDEDVLTASTTSAGGAGTFDIVVTNLAERQKLATSTTFTDGDTEVGTGTLSITVGSNNFDVVIDNDNDTLAQIRDAINNAADNQGVTASIINETGGSRLVLTANNTGTANTVSVAVSSATGNLSQLESANLNTIQAAEDATLTIDGFNVTSSSNKVSGVVDGLELDLKKTGSATVNTERDTDAIKESVQDFVNAYNSVRSTTLRLKTGSLEGDSAIRTIENQLRSVINTQPSGLGGTFTALQEIGVTLDKDGNLSLDSSDLEDSLDTDLASVAAIFSDPTEGYAARFKALADNMVDTDGIVDSREDGLNDRIRSNEDRELAFERRLTAVEAGLRSQYSALDGLLAGLQSTSSFLTSQLATLPRAG